MRCHDKDLGEPPLTRTCCQFLVVHLSKKITDTVRSYWDAEFAMIWHVSVSLNHNVMELSRVRFEELYRRLARTPLETYLCCNYRQPLPA